MHQKRVASGFSDPLPNCHRKSFLVALLVTLVFVCSGPSPIVAEVSQSFPSMSSTHGESQGLSNVGGNKGFFRWVGSYGVPGHEAGQFLEPKAMAFSPDGARLAVCDTANNRIVILKLSTLQSEVQQSAASDSGKMIKAAGRPVAAFVFEKVLGDIWPFEGSTTPHDWPDRYRERDHTDGLLPQRELKGRAFQGGQARIRKWDRVPMDRFYLPQGVVWKDADTLIVSDTGNHRLKVVSLKGEVVAIIGQEGWKDGYFHHPMGIDLDQKGNLLVTEPRSKFIRGLGLDFAQRQRSQGNRLQVFSPEYKFVRRFGHMHHMSGRLDRQFKDLTRVYAAPNADLFLTDSGNHRILVYSAEGKPKGELKSWPFHNLRYPQGVHGDDSGRIAVADTGNHVVLILDGDRLHQIIGGFGIEKGRFVEPRDVRFGPDGNLYVLDSTNCRIQIFASDNPPKKSPVGPRQLTPQVVATAPIELPADSPEGQIGESW